MHGAHGLFRKGWPHEESVRVPLLVRLPDGEERQPAREDVPARLAPRSSPLDPGLGGPVRRRDTVRGVPIDLDAVRRAAAASMRPRLARPAHRPAQTGAGRGRTPWLYFDLEADPMETANLAGDPARAAEIRELGRSLP